MKTLKNENDIKFYDDIKKSLVKYKFDDSIIDQIFDIIDNNTNKNHNFEYFKSSYDDIIDDDIIIDFLKDKEKNQYNSIDDIKCDLEYFLYDKYFFDYWFYYDEELIKQLNQIVIEKKDWSIEYLDWSQIFSDLREELWIFDLDIDYNSLFKSSYDCIISIDQDESIFYNWFNSDNLKDEYSKRKLKENHYLIDDLCKNNWFSIKDIFTYCEGDENKISYWKASKLYENNNVFRWLYKEYLNYLWYMDWNITNLVSLNIDQILSFYVKDSYFEFWLWWLLWINDSIYELSLNKPLKAKTSDLVLDFYKWSTIKRTYDFNTRYF